MEGSNNTDSAAPESQILDISTPVKKNDARTKKPRSLKRKWVILAIIFVLAIAPAIFILIRSSSDTKTEKTYEDCIRECVLLKDTGEIDVPYGNCFEYCREGLSSP
jgi:hypothetical protein